MSETRTFRVALMALPLLLLAFLAVVGAVWAGSSVSPAVNWQAMSGGGAPALSGTGALALSGTLGQAAIGPSDSSGASLGAGFWYGVGYGRAYPVYLPLVMRSR